MKIVAGIDSLNIPDLFATATRRIVLHAAVYGPFADSAPHREGLAKALARSSFERLDIIAIETGTETAWRADFFETLRFDQDSHSIEQEVRTSHDFLMKLSAEHPDKIYLHPAKKLPCLPIIIADDTIVFGQYAHADVYAPQGFWGIAEADVEKLMQWAATGHAPATATREELAAYRLACECFHAMQDAPMSTANE